MSGNIKFRLSALFPLVLSCISWALVIVLLLSGTNPDLISDGYLLRVSELFLFLFLELGTKMLCEVKG
jgi:hypothetical protein